MEAQAFEPTQAYESIDMFENDVFIRGPVLAHSKELRRDQPLQDSATECRDI